LQGNLGFAATHIVNRDSNYGLARNITAGVSEVLKIRDTVIVLEDDITVSPFFLRFMNEALGCYKGNPTVGSISGYCYPVTDPVPETYFIRGADCWGWATWRDRWQVYNPDGPALLRELKARNLCHAFDFDGAMGFVQMLKDQIAGRNDSWAVRWHASCYLRDMLILYPGRALAHNIGHDGSGTHSLQEDDSFNVMLSPTAITVGGIEVAENAQAREAIRRFFRKGPPSAAYEPAANQAPSTARLQKTLRRLLARYLPLGIVNVLRAIRSRQSAALHMADPARAAMPPKAPAAPKAPPHQSRPAAILRCAIARLRNLARYRSKMSR